MSHPLGCLLSENQKITSVAEYVEESEALCTVGGNVEWYSHYGNKDVGVGWSEGSELPLLIVPSYRWDCLFYSYPLLTTELYWS